MNKWILTKDELPENSKHVIVAYRNELGMPRRVRAIYERKFEIVIDDYDNGCYYDEKDDEYYLKEGWYESCDGSENYYDIECEVLCWCGLPKLPRWF